MSSVSGDTVFVIVSLVLASLVVVNTLKLDNQQVIEKEMMKYRTQELAMSTEMVADFQDTGSMEVTYPIVYDVTFSENTNPGGNNPPNAYESKITLTGKNTSHTAGIGVELQNYGQFENSTVCIEQKYPPSDIRNLRMSNAEFVRDYLKDNLQQACDTSGIRNYPPGGKFSFSLNGVNRVKLKHKSRTIRPNKVIMKLDYGGRTEKYTIDKNNLHGLLADWRCTGNPGSGMYQFNGSTVSNQHSSSAGADGTNKWINLDSSKVTRWRVMEETDNQYVNIQIDQVDPSNVPGDKLVELKEGECG